ncbi:hypothetical protein BJP36_06030 [Moorena producens JHB]|uniref:Uncharacterized protein n=1 Tax=Moorena producens (strain JHB) TaxID=1454205 RepID=A0A1D9FVY1_MOOP1|nr:hypothetical protein [Moorena producens]AOY79539.1 hypothetical protein BJP36_06030 [Moorena producens JHB]
MVRYGATGYSVKYHGNPSPNAPYAPYFYCLLPTPYSLLPTPYSLLPAPYSLLPNGNQDGAISDQQESPETVAQSE